MTAIDYLNYDLYKLFDSSSILSANDLNVAYKTLAHKYHPDKGGNEKDFNLIKEVFQWLKDPVNKIKYDDMYVSKRNVFKTNYLENVTVKIETD
jgi:DnaJ-class molecular chaperone